MKDNAVEMHYCLADTALGRVGFVWTYEKRKPLVKRICLPDRKGREEAEILQAFPRAVKGADDIIAGMVASIRKYLAGESVALSLDYLDMNVCSAFQQEVLRWDRRIPRGMVATYGGLAAKANRPKGARAVGSVQAANPFPLIIPCHRVIRTDGTLGGFGGGLEMKRKLLKLEGISFDAAGKVRPQYIWR